MNNSAYDLFWVAYWYSTYSLSKGEAPSSLVIITKAAYPPEEIVKAPTPPAQNLYYENLARIVSMLR